MNIKNLRRLPRWAVYAIFGLLCVALLVVLRTLRPQQLHTTYSLVFSDLYKSAPTVEIASFDEGERWKGLMTLDSVRTIDGETGMNIFSMNAVPNKVVLTSALNLQPYKYISSAIFVEKEESLGSLKRLTIGFTDGKGRELSYDIPPLKRGWNFVNMRLADFKPHGLDPTAITTTYIELVSKKGQTAQVTFDRIWAQHELDKKDFSTVDQNYVSLKTVTKKTYLHIATPLPTTVTFAKVVSVPRFSYTAGFSPLRFGTFGLSYLTDPQGNGYYFMVSGPHMDQWQIIKKADGVETELQHGTLPQNTFEKLAMLWLRVEKNGETHTFSFSVNGQQYNAITDLKDLTFSKGSLGINASGSYLIDSIDVKE